jgi:hypothetical protein
LYFETTAAYSLSASFATRICSFLERDVATVRHGQLLVVMSAKFLERLLLVCRLIRLPLKTF